MTTDIEDVLRENEVLQDRLELSRQALQEFAYAVSHDLGSPLRAVTSFSEIMMKKYYADMDERGRTYMNFINGGGQKAQAMLAGLLSYARVYTQGEAPQHVSLRDLVANAMRAHEERMSHCQAHLTLGELPTLFCDAKQIEQLITIMIDNAMTYRYPQIPLEISISATASESHWVLAVADNGIGIPQENRQRIFQVFKRLHTDNEYPGIGMGLPIAARIIERHGGQINVTSGERGGSVFIWTLDKNGPVQTRPHEQKGG